MATFKDRDVFEYCEKLYEQFKKSTMGTIRINTMMLFFNKWQIILQLRKRML